MLSALISSELSYPAMRLASQPVHQRFVHSGPLVLGAAPVKLPTPTADRDQTVSRRFKPSSRTTLNGEQPYPWDRLQPQDVIEPTSRCQTPPSIWTLGRNQPVIPGATFYPLSDGPSIQNHRITMSCFRTCSTCQSRSQARFCHCTLGTMSDRTKRTFELLRYSLGGDRPSQTAHHALSPARITGQG